MAPDSGPVNLNDSEKD